VGIGRDEGRGNRKRKGEKMTGEMKTGKRG